MMWFHGTADGRGRETFPPAEGWKSSEPPCRKSVIRGGSLRSKTKAGETLALEALAMKQGAGGASSTANFSEFTKLSQQTQTPPEQ